MGMTCLAATVDTAVKCHTRMEIKDEHSEKLYLDPYAGQLLLTMEHSDRILLDFLAYREG